MCVSYVVLHNDNFWQVFFSADEVKSSECSCAIGRYGKCHHVAALLIYANRHISPTDVACAWTHKKKAGDENEGHPIDHYYPKMRPDYAAIPGPLCQDELKECMKNIPMCKGAALSIKWLTDPEPDPFTVCNDVDDALTIRIPPIEEAIRSSGFKACATVSDKVQYLTKYCALSAADITAIADFTAGQSENPLWAPLHTHVLTASNFGFGIRASTMKHSCNSLMAAISGKSWSSKGKKGNRKKQPGNDSERAVDWGKANESTAFKWFKDCNPHLSVKETGLWYHNSSVLAASPDGLVDHNAVLEIKCPFTMRSVKNIKTFLQEQYIAEKYSGKRKGVKKVCITFDEEGSCLVDPDHDHYHQMQGQMFCTGRTLCYYVVWTSEDCISVPIPQDAEWVEKKAPLLFLTYFQRYVPFAFSD